MDSYQTVHESTFKFLDNDYHLDLKNCHKYFFFPSL